jgi:hypothetical protein
MKKNLSRPTYLLIVLLALAGCTTAAERQYQQIIENTQTASTEYKNCTSTVYNSPEASPYREHISDPRNVTLDQMMDSSKATSEQIAAIKATYPKIAECRNALFTKLSTATPTIAVVFADAWQQSDAALIELIQQKTTWGKYVSTSRDIEMAWLKQLTEETQKILSGLQRSYENELAQRQAAINAMMQYLQTQEMINAMNKPVITNCSGFGNSVNCISQ